MRPAGQYRLTLEALAKIPMHNSCHSEGSEESRIFKRLRAFTSFRMTEKPILQEALWVLVMVAKIEGGGGGGNHEGRGLALLFPMGPASAAGGRLLNELQPARLPVIGCPDSPRPPG
jgi:hypothetical protein